MPRRGATAAARHVAAPVPATALACRQAGDWRRKAVSRRRQPQLTTSPVSRCLEPSPEAGGAFPAPEIALQKSRNLWHLEVTPAVVGRGDGRTAGSGYTRQGEGLCRSAENGIV